MQISLILMGKTSESCFSAAMEGYERQFPSFLNYQRIEISTPKYSKTIDKTSILRKEAALFQKNLQAGDHVVLLDEKGKMYDSVEFAAFIKHKKEHLNKPVKFLVGGAYGFHEDIHRQAQTKISLSPMTFTHQMVRLFFVEQLYRAFSILQNKAYHHA